MSDAAYDPAMQPEVAPPSGAARRRKRIPDEETERRVLDAAVRAVSELGLTVSLEHLSFEEIIRDADVSRSSVYRRWPYKDLFFADLLLELARSTDLYDESDHPLVDALATIEERRDDLRTDAGRRALVVDLLHRSLEQDLESVYASPRWRTYIALNATFAGLPDGDLRARVGDALKATERRFTAQRAALLARVIPLLGYRLVAPLEDPDGYELLAYAVGSTYTGLIIRALSDPDLLTHKRPLQPPGAPHPDDWSTAALIATTTFLAFIEPDPTSTWTDNHITETLAALKELATPPRADG